MSKYNNSLSCIFIGFFGVAWLVPNHYYPWASFWSDLVASITIAGLLLSYLISKRNKRIYLPHIFLLFLLISFVPLIQILVGVINFSGDGWVSSLYLLGFSMSIALPKLLRCDMKSLMGTMAWMVLISSLISLVLAVSQWLNVNYIGVFLIDMPYGGRPYANIGQPNNLGTVFVLGIVAIWALFNYEKLSSTMAMFLSLLLSFGIAMCQSRTAILEMIVFLIAVLLLKRRVNLKINSFQLIFVFILMAASLWMWPKVNNSLQIEGYRTFEDQISLVRDLRIPIWSSLINAIFEKPWFGFGWNQVAIAQHMIGHEGFQKSTFTEHSHNIILDLILWAGLPLGIFIVLNFGKWVWIRFNSCKNQMAAWALVSILIFLSHGMLEYPLEYAYFLLPMGFMIGVVEFYSPSVIVIVFSRKIINLLIISGLSLYCLVIYEYVIIERAYRELRFSWAGYNISGSDVKLEKIRILNQHIEYSKFIENQPKRNMSPAALQQMRKVAERFGYPPVLFRYALALAINNQPSFAQKEINILCKNYINARCEEGRDLWQKLSDSTYPEIKFVHWPSY